MVEDKENKGLEKKATEALVVDEKKTEVLEEKSQDNGEVVVEDKNSAKKEKKLEDYRTLGKSSKAEKSESAVKKAESKKKKDEKTEVEIDRIYIVPMRRGFLKVPAYKRAKKAVKTLKEFLAKHMKVEGRDLNKVKVDMYLNNEIWFKGIKKPLSKVKVRAKKIAGIVYVELAEMPEIVKFKKAKDEKKTTKVDKKKLNKVVSQEAAQEKTRIGREDKSVKSEEKEKDTATAEAGFAKNKEQAKMDKHTARALSAKMDMMSETSKRKAMKR